MAIIMVQHIVTLKIVSLNLATSFGSQLMMVHTAVNYGIHDGTEAGTLMFSDIREGSSGSNPSFRFTMGDYFYFTAHDGDSSRFFMTDGKQMIMDLNLHSGDVYSYTTPVMFQGEYYMNLYTQPTGYELWKSDGTSDGTVMVHEFQSGTSSGSPQDFVVLNNKVLLMRVYPGNYANIFAYAPSDYEL